MCWFTSVANDGRFVTTQVDTLYGRLYVRVYERFNYQEVEGDGSNHIKTFLGHDGYRVVSFQTLSLLS